MMGHETIQEAPQHGEALQPLSTSVLLELSTQPMYGGGAST